MILLSAQNLEKTYMERKVLDDVSFFLGEGDKVGIIGINGTGKSTLLRILAGAEEPDSGTVIRTKGVRVSYLPQIPEFDTHGSVLEQVMAHLPLDLKAAKEFEAKSILGKLGIADYDRDISTLSGGERRRVGIAAALIQPSDVLLLDEPTNHIDNDTVQLLEEQLRKYRGAIVMVTHDRYFLNRITQKIVEVDRGKIYEYNGSYSTYLEQKAQREADAEAQERKNRTLYRQELEWIRRGVRARGTKSKDRIERFHALENRDKPQEMEKMQLQSVSSRLGKKTIELEHLSKSIDGKQLLRDFSYKLPRDARIGVVGRNGAGKSTLIKLICGDLLPDSGNVVLGDTVRIGYFSQECEKMDPSQRVIDYIKETAERIQTPDGTVTAATMLERFLFTPELQWNHIEKLSGGERKRLYLLKVLMTAPNVLLLDEPTNDLDIQTLTILEDYLDRFDGIIIIVSHDRYFLDRTVNRIFSFEGNGVIRQFEGGYSDYLIRKELESPESGNVSASLKAQNASSGKDNSESDENDNNSANSQDAWKRREKKLKFSFKEQREFDTIDEEIEVLEQKIADLDSEMMKSATNSVKLGELMVKKDETEKALEEKMDRWVYLNDLNERILNGE